MSFRVCLMKKYEVWTGVRGRPLSPAAASSFFTTAEYATPTTLSSRQAS